MPLLVNLQRKVKIETSGLKVFALKLLQGVEESFEKDFSIAFVSDRRMKELNGFFRGKESTTDVLSFPHEPDDFLQNASVSLSLEEEEQAKTCTLNANYLGDIVISVEQAQKQAKENRLTLENEIKQLILHGLLHLCGYDHETDDGEMNARELELRRTLKI
ncbi:MAG: rRNA maturation RNase YbeY [Acidobacteriota bacterium]